MQEENGEQQEGSMAVWGAENAQDNHSRQREREQRREKLTRQASAAQAAGRGKRRV